MKQDSFIQSCVFRDPMPIFDVLIAFYDFLNQEEDIRPWGNSARFDLGILISASKRLGIKVPWDFCNERCYRTLKNLYPEIKCNEVATHNALNDALLQAQHTIIICKEKGIKL